MYEFFTKTLLGKKEFCKNRRVDGYAVGHRLKNLVLKFPHFSAVLGEIPYITLSCDAS